MRNSIFLAMLFFVALNIFCLSKKAFTDKDNLFFSPIDTAFTSIVNDSLYVNYANFFILKIKRFSKETDEKLLFLELMNISAFELYMDTINLDQYSKDNKYWFIYNPDINCHSPLQFTMLKPTRSLIIQSTLKVDPQIEFITISLLGAKNISLLKNDTNGQLDTIYINEEPIYTLRFRCEEYPKSNLFHITVQNIPVSEMKGSVTVRVNSK